MRSAICALGLFSTPLLAQTGLAAPSTERLYQEACDAGDLIACNVFGLMYETGDQVPPDPFRALEFYERACQGGEMVGCTNLGLMYEAGLAVPADPLRARGLYQVACEGGEMLGCSRLRATEAAPAVPEARYQKTGRVGDGETNLPIGNALIEVPALDVRTVSDGRGRFELTNLPPGRYSIWAESLGYERIEGELVVPGDPDFVVLLLPIELDDPDAAARIVGRVTEESGEPLADVAVQVVQQASTQGLSNESGRFNLMRVEPGLAVVRLSRIGYAPRTAMVIAQPGQTVDIEAKLVVEPIELEAIEVSVRSRLLEQGGFYGRVERGFGSFIQPRELDEMQPVLLSDAFRMSGIPGIRFQQDIVAGVTRVLSRRAGAFSNGECVMPVFLDGVRMPDPNIDLIPANAIEAVEVYHGVETPAEYMGTRNSLDGGAVCGAVVLWSRRGA